MEVSRYPIRPFSLRLITMPSGSLIPDRQLTFSPELAETIGLEEAILLQALGTKLIDRDGWTTIVLLELQQTMPFWSVDHITQLSDKLVALGILARSGHHDPTTLVLSATALAVPAKRIDTEPAAPAHDPRPAFEAHSRHWQPSDALVDLLVMTQGIPRAFVNSIASAFLPSENGRDVDTQFRQHALARWRAQQGLTTAFEITTPAPFGKDWQPNQDALDILEQAGIDPGFADSVRAEFVLYWSERGGPPKEINTRFVEHVRRRWLRHTSQIHHSTEPIRIPRHWQPDVAVYDTLRLAGISEQDAKALLPEFVMYWIDSNEVHTSWNSKFLQHVKRQTQSAHYGGHDGGEKGRGGTGASHRSKDRSLNDDLTDTSWAN